MDGLRGSVVPAVRMERAGFTAATRAMPSTPPPGVSDAEWSRADTQPAPVTTAAPVVPVTGSDAVRSGQRQRLLRAVAQLVSSELNTLARSGDASPRELQRLADLLDSVLALQPVPTAYAGDGRLGGRRDF